MKKTKVVKNNEYYYYLHVLVFQSVNRPPVGSLDFADNGLSGEKKETSILRFLIRINDNKTTSTKILLSIN